MTKNENDLFKDDSNINTNEMNVLDDWGLRMLLNKNMKRPLIRKKDND